MLFSLLPDIKYTKKTIIIILLLSIFTLTLTTKLLFNRLQAQRISSYMSYPSLLPQLDYTVAIRFDPSFYYDRNKRPRNLAVMLAQKWEAAGINLVFYRAYDPSYGAFYNTNYRFNEMGDFGKFDLLKHVIKECHERGIQVYAWMPVLNHRVAWEQNSSWHARLNSGADYQAQGFEFPLCARNKEMREWWYGFIEDFLEQYPQIDGMDFAEPVVSWSKGQACFCDLCRKAFQKVKSPLDIARIRASALTEVLGDSIDIVHRAGKKTCITFVQNAHRTGELISPEEFMTISGFDLENIVRGGAGRTPDMICAEFIWQELKSRDKKNKQVSVFDPVWTENAFKTFLSWIDTPVKVIAHLEITDFPGVPVKAKDLENSILAAIRAGASGIDVYSSNQLDQKDAWKILANIKNISRKKNCLVLFDQEAGDNDALQIGTLLRHFNVEVSYKPVSEYSHTEDQYDVIFYVGVVSGADIPQALLTEILRRKKTICWLGFNIETALSQDEISNALGLDYIGVEREQFNTVQYKNIQLPKNDPWSTVVKAFDNTKCKVIATAQGIEGDIPYALRSGRYFWYFSDVPSSHAIEGGRYLVFSDLLHDILNEPHKAENLALVRIEDVHPLTDPESLEQIADFLYREKVPFHIAVVPYYVYPEKNFYVGLHEKPRLVKALKYMVKKGGSVVMHGTTHQRFGETTSDYEFWDPVNDHPPDGENSVTIREKIEAGLREFWSVGIYPLMWETPHYAGSNLLYSVVKDFFSLSMERRQAIDKLGTDQIFPYLIVNDSYGQMIVPENLGYVPLNSQRAELILNPARNMKVVRDGVASFFFHPFVDLNILKQIIKSMKKEGCRFTSIGNLPIRVETPFGIVTNTSGTVSVSTKRINGKEIRLVFPGIPGKSETIQTIPAERFTRNIELAEGELYAAHFISPLDLNGMEEGTSTATKESIQSLHKVSNFYGEQCEVPRPLVISLSPKPFKLEEASQEMTSLFELIGVPVLREHVSAFSQIPSGINVLLLPENAARALNGAQISMVVQALKQDKISLVTAGFTALSDELGIEKVNRLVTVSNLKDNYFLDVKTHWNPPQEVYLFESPSDASYIYTDIKTENPLLISGRIGKGNYIFINSPLNKDFANQKDRYPHLLTHIFRCFSLFPLIRNADAEVYFNPAEREGISIETLIKDWRRSGVRTVYVAAWQVFPEWTYNYAHLVRLAHTNGILVYAWFELPYVNEKFWIDHPEWREKNASGQDVVIGWRKPMAMGIPDCYRSVEQEITRLLDSYDWDGVVLNNIGWETPQKKLDSSTYTPFHPIICSDFSKLFGFDPRDLFDTNSKRYWQHSPVSMKQFNAFRQNLALQWSNNLLASLRSLQKDLEIIVTYDTKRSENGLLLEDYISLKKSFGIHLQLSTDMENQWEMLSPQFDMTRLSFSSSSNTDGFHPRAVTAYPTGTTLYRMINKFIKNNKRFSLFSENALFEIDKQIFPFLFSTESKMVWADDHLNVEVPSSVHLVFAQNDDNHMSVDGKLAGSFYNASLFVPIGMHRIMPDTGRVNPLLALKSKTRLEDSSADLIETVVTSLGIDITYWGDRRTVIVLNEEPREVLLDGAATLFKAEKGLSGWAVMLPKGKHTVCVKTRSVTDLLLVALSLIVSNTILLISLIAIAGLLVIATITVVKRKTFKVKKALV